MINKPRNLGGLLANALVITLSLLWLVPLAFTLLVSVRPENEPITNGNIFFDCIDHTTSTVDTANGFNLLGCTFTLQNYQDALQVAPWPTHYANSLIFVFGTLVVQVVTITMAGYAFARMKFAGRDILLFLILLQLMIPTGVLIVQNFVIVRNLGLFDTQVALMLPYWGSAFGTLLMRQAFREVPYELEEAARIDGANWLQIMRNIYIPLSVPTYVAFSLVSISSHWNEFLWPFIVTRSDAVRPLTVALNKLLKTTEVGALYGQLMAGTVLVIAPLVILFILFQRRFIESFASSGIK
ncbi:MAG: carbohydrate ABC transporter permease [Anaerolineae bacterium]|nr:carbohydrate ABC transporter permease [Anaerolineae bacterium]